MCLLRCRENVKQKPKAWTAKQQPKKKPRSRSEEHKKRWTEERLKQLGPNSMAMKTWNLIKNGYTELAKERLAEFQEKFRDTGNFDFVEGLKWNRHLFTEEQSHDKGWFTRAMIQDREKDQKATDAIIAKAIAANLWYMDSYREVERYWYEGVDVLTAKESTEKGMLTRSSTGQVPTQAVGAVSSSSTLGPALQDWPGASPKAVAAPALPLQNAEAEETINDAAPSSAQTLELGGGSQTLELGGDSPSEPHATQPDSPDARLVEEQVMYARALLPSLSEHGRRMHGFIDEILSLIDSIHQTDDLEEKDSLRIDLDVECHKAAAVRNLLAYWDD